MTKRLLQLSTLLILCLWLVGAVAASDTIAASQDATLDYANPTQVADDAQLSVGYSNFLSTFQPTTQAILQFDVSGADTVNRAALRLNLGQNLLQADSATLAVYAIEADQWAQGSINYLNAPKIAAAATPLATLAIDGDDFGEIELGTIDSASALSQHIEAQRTGDGHVSLLVRLDGVTNGDLAGMVAFASREGFAAPLLVLSAESVPTAINLYSNTITSTYLSLLAIAAFLALTTLSIWVRLRGAQRHFSHNALFQLVRPRRPLRRGKNWHSALSLRWFLGLFLVVGMGFGFRPKIHAADCQTPTRPANFTIEMSAGAYMHWDDNPANDAGYLIWRGTNVAYPDTTQPPHVTLDAGHASFYETETMTEVEWTYVVAGRNSCGDVSEPTAPVGVKQYALDGTKWQPISVPFSGGAFPITDAQSLLNTVFGIDAVARWNPERQVMSIYRNDGGDNFAIAAGDTIFILPQEWTETVSFAGNVERIDYMLETGGISFLTIPLHRSDITTLADLFNAIPNVETLYVWDSATGDFVPYNGTGNNAPLNPTQPVGVKLAAQADREIQQWPGDAAQLVWSERDNQQGKRDIYLRWYDGTLDVANKYSVYRRALTEVEWTYIGGTEFVKDAGTFEALVSADLRTALAKDMGVAVADLYTFLAANLDLAQLHADQHPELALALGMAFFDDNIDFVEWTYKVEVERGGGSAELLQQSCVPTPPTARVEWTYTPLDPQENNIADVPADLGVAPSARPLDAAERTDWDKAQQFRQMDGRVYLDWNGAKLPDPSLAPTPTCPTNGDIQIAGYHVYRRHALTGNAWELANTTSSGGTPILARISSDDFQFEDAVHAIYGDAAYDKWDYKVCAVDYLGQEVVCEEALEIWVRELDSPSAVANLTAMMNDDHSQLSVEWTYSDPDEVHTPVEFVVSRATSHTATEWEDYPATSSSAITIDKTDDEGVTYWYRVQVRDDAGNWSAPSAPVHATFYPRSAPPFAPELDNADCVTNTMPLQLDGLDERIVQVAMYRGFSADGPFQIIDRFRVEAGSVLIEEDVTPPSSVIAWYMLEAFDAHGNPSAPQFYCAGLPGANPQPQPPLDIIWPQTKADNPQVVAEGDLPDDLTVTLFVPGQDGETSIDVQLDANGEFVWSESVEDALESGGSVRVEITQADVLGNPSEVAQFGPYYADQPIDGEYVQWNALDLGAAFSAEWDNTAATPTAHIRIADKYACEDCTAFPYLALYRRVLGGRWQQVNRPIPANETVDVDGIWRLTDTHDLSPQQTYQYKVSLLSPVTFEPLGTAATLTLPARDAAQTLVLGEIAPVAAPNCGNMNPISPAAASLRDSIIFPEGDILISSYYQIDGSCQQVAPDLAHAYGEGTLNYGGETFAVQFYDVHIKETNGTLLGGRIVVETGNYVSADYPLARFPKVEIDSNGVFAQLDAILPDTIMLVDSNDTTKRYDQVSARVQLGNNWAHSDVIVTSYRVLDENLPWHFMADAFALNGAEIKLPDGTLTSYRFESAEFDDTPFDKMIGNNLGFAEPAYGTVDVRFDADGAQGLIQTEVEWTYMTAQPAAFMVTFGGAALTLADGQISSGSLTNATSRILYHEDRPIQYSLRRLELDHPPSLTHSEAVVPVHSEDGLRSHFIAPENLTFAVGENGRLFSPVANHSTRWGSFDTSTLNGHLFIAPAIIENNIDPHRNGWKPLYAGDTRYEPGLNLHRTLNVDDSQSVQYSCFTGDPFDASLQLYVRRGGVSGSLAFSNAENNVRLLHDFPTQVKRFQALFRESDILHGDMGLDVQLPYPSDFTIPANMNDFSPREGCPAAGTPDNDGKVQHDYWDLDQQITHLAFINTDPILYGGGGRSADMPTMLLELQGVIDMPQISSVADPATFLKIGGRSHWFPTGDVGNIDIFTGNLADELLDVPEVRVNGMYHLLTDLLPTRYFGPDGKPDLAGLVLDNILSETELTTDALQQCSLTQVVGCGIMILDGHSAVDMFGELEDEILDEVDAWFPQGSSPVAFYRENEQDIQAFINDPNIAWEWANGSEYNEWGIPVKMMANPDGAVVAGVLADLNLVDVVRGDFGFVITMLWDNDALVEEVGIYSGYAASQGVLRALSHYFKHDTQFPAWTPELEAAMQGWAEQFGYAIGDEGDDDPVDLAKEKWGSWGQRRFVEVFSVMESKVRGLNGSDKYGVASLQTGDVLDDLGVTMATNLGATTIIPFGEGKVLQDLYFGTKLKIDGEGEQPFVDARWIKLEYDKDGEFRIFGDDVETALSEELVVSADLALLIAWADGNERIEGGVILQNFETGDVEFRELGGAFGVGRYQGDLLLYIGVKGEGRWDEYVLGGSFLVGNLYDSPVLRHAGFDEAISKLTAGDQPLPFFGFYLNVYGEFPLYDSGVLRANGVGELTLWYYEATPHDIWGGQLEASVYATLAEIISGRGTLNMVFEKLANGVESSDVGWQSIRQTCESADGCTAFSGTFWVAAGAGWCEPSKWTRWERRWWRDSWCYQVGAIVGLSYLDTAGWEADYDVDWE